MGQADHVHAYENITIIESFSAIQMSLTMILLLTGWRAIRQHIVCIRDSVLRIIK